MIDNPVPWPNGANCAATFTFDIDTDSFLHLRIFINNYVYLKVRIAGFPK